MASLLYNYGKGLLLTQGWTGGGLTYKALLVRAGYTPNADHQYVSSITGGGTDYEFNEDGTGDNYEAGFSGSGRATLANRVVVVDTSIDRARIACDDILWSSLKHASDDAIGAAVYYHLTSDAASTLIAFLDCADFSPTGFTHFTLHIHATEGIAYWDNA